MHFIIIFFLFMVFSYGEGYEERFYKDCDAIPKGFGLHMDMGYSFYSVEVDSSEINSIIDYNLWESTFGFSYRYGVWMLGAYVKMVLNELESNMYMVSTYEKLKGHAKINKSEFAFYINHTLFERKSHRWNINLLYREGKLHAKNWYVSFNSYENYVNYTTKGIALSLVYSHTFYKKNFGFISGGILYSHANVKVGEVRVNGCPQDAFILDHREAIGRKIAFGYNHHLSKYWIVNFRIDGWYLDFDKVKVLSAVGDQLPKARLEEQSLSSYVGLTWHF